MQQVGCVPSVQSILFDARKIAYSAALLTLTTASTLVNHLQICEIHPEETSS